MVSVPQFLSDVYSAFAMALAQAYVDWSVLPIFERLLCGVLLAAFSIYLGSKSENSGWSAVWFFAAFGLLAYVLAEAMAQIH